jgi:indole-3-glycerol phosphate synthase
LNILDRILVNTRAQIEQARAARPLAALSHAPAYHSPPRDFHAAIAGRTGKPRPALIAEIKAASPSAGQIRADFDPVGIARAYHAAGAAALSVLTDATFFGGSLEHIEQVRRAVPLPVLRKDCLIDAYQVHESRAAGADAVLLIAEALPPARLELLLALALDLDLTVLLEVHERESLEALLPLIERSRGRRLLLGVNNRDLQAQTIDLANAERLAPLVPRDVPLVGESGIKTRYDVERMRRAGVAALLIGETLLRSPDPAAAVRELFDTTNEL